MGQNMETVGHVLGQFPIGCTGLGGSCETFLAQ